MNEPAVTCETGSRQTSAVASVFRWIAVLPACIVAALLASIVVKVLGNLGLSFALVDADSPLRLIVTEWGANVVFGGVQVYVGSLIAPGYRKQTAVAIAALNLLLSGAALLIFIGQQQYLGIAGTVAMNVGSIALAIMIFKGEVHFSQH